MTPDGISSNTKFGIRQVTLLETTALEIIAYNHIYDSTCAYCVECYMTLRP